MKITEESQGFAKSLIIHYIDGGSFDEAVRLQSELLGLLPPTGNHTIVDVRTSSRWMSCQVWISQLRKLDGVEPVHLLKAWLTKAHQTCPGRP